MIEAIGSGLTSVIGWCGDVVSAFTGADGALKDLLPLLGIGIAVSVVMLGCRLLKSFTWAS